MERGCRGTEVIQCEQYEINALHKEDNQVVLILLDHFRATRRQECLSRVATAFLMLSCLAVFLFFRICPQPVEAAHGNEVERHHQQNSEPPARQLGKPDGLPQPRVPHAHLTVLPPHMWCNPTPNQKTLAWEAERGLAYTHEFSYVQQKRALIVPVEGYYEVYLQVTFVMPDGCVSDHEKCRLGAEVFSTWDNVKSPLMRLSETMPRGGPILKSVFGSGIFFLKKNAELSVDVTNSTDITLVDRVHETNTFFGASLSFLE